MNLTPEEQAALDTLDAPSARPANARDPRQIYIDAIVAEYRVMGRIQRWLFRQAAPFTEIAARHLEALDKETR